jgi:predicted DCC family thiol-disulfide oxidoreductase YuxK
MRSSAQERRVSLPPRLVLFDGVCGFCDRAVRWLIERDPRERLHFAPLQGETAAALRRRHPEIPEDTDTVVYVQIDGRGDCDGDGEHVHLRSAAIFRIAAEITGPWRRLAWLRWLPRPLADAGYRLFAGLRYRLFGKRDACARPLPGERARFVA